MKILHEYMTRKKLRQAEFARLVGEPPTVINKLLNGRLKMSIRMASIFEYGTNGELKAEDLCARQHERELIRFRKTGVKTEEGRLSLELEQTK